MNDHRRVVVTGMGAVCSIGMNVDEIWSSMLAGRSGIGQLSAFDTSAYKVHLAAEIENDALRSTLQARGWKPYDRAVDIAVESAGQALEQAGLIGEAPFENQELPVIIGSGVGPAESLWTSYEKFNQRGPRGLRPTTVPRCMANTFSASLSIHYRLTGTNYVVVSACASSTNAIGDAFRKIRDGYSERVLCGGTEAFFDPFYYGVWNNLGVLSKIEDPAEAYRPFDTARQGCLLGEGAGMLILESFDSAHARGAAILGEVLGYGDSSDATHLTRPSVEGQSSAIRTALSTANVQPTEIGFINAHGTATQANDVTESQSIRAALGSAADSIPVGANKSYFGHLLGAAGAVESIVTLKGLAERQVPGNLNLTEPDPACDLHFVGATPERIENPIAMKNNFGFGGGNAVLVFKRADAV